jgi:lysophospholipase L1-like esterase
MPNVVNFKINGLTAALTNQYVRVTDTARNELYSGNTLTTDIAGNASINLLGAGAVGQDTLINGDNFLDAGLINYKGFRGTGAIESLLYDIDTVVIFGASIMEQSFSGAGEASTEALFAAQGATITVHERATSGDNTTNMLAKLPALISEFSANASKTMFVIHWAGNDISQSGPYPGGASTIDNNCRAMCQDLKDAGYKIALSDTTYRIPPASNPSAPYNQNVMSSVIADFADISLSLYDLTFNNQGTWYEVDGIHPNGVGEDMNRNYVVDTIIPNIITGAIPAPIMWEDVVLQFGLLNVYPDGSNSMTIDTTETPIKNVDLSVVENASITLSGSGGHSDELGRGNVLDPLDTSISLTNNKGLLSYTFSSGGTISVEFTNSQIEPLATYTVGVTASRDTTDTNRDCDIVVAGVTQALNVAESPAPIVEFTGVLGSDLIATGVTSTASATFTFAYIGMIRVTKEP